MRLQNIADHYHLTDYDWPFAHDVNPTATDVMRYIHAAAHHFKLNVQLNHDVTGLHEATGGWTVDLETPEGKRSEPFDYVVVAAGHYTHEKPALALPGQELFKGKIVTERDITELALFDGKRVVVVGFGKSAVDMAVFALERAKQVDHVFREARWLMPRKMMGRNIAHVASARMSTIYSSSWVHPGKFAQLMHRRASTASGYAAMVG